jgi:hypothetical protein
MRPCLSLQRLHPPHLRREDMLHDPMDREVVPHTVAEDEAVTAEVVHEEEDAEDRDGKCEPSLNSIRRSSISDE